MPFRIPWDNLDKWQVFALIIILAFLILGWRLMNYGLKAWTEENRKTHQVFRDALTRSEDRSDAQQLLCTQHVDHVSYNKEQLIALRNAGVEGCRAIRLLADQLGNESRDQLIRNVDEAERLLRRVDKKQD